MTDTITSVLDADTALLNSDIIANPPRAEPFTRLKECLLSLYGELPEARLRRLLRGQISTDGKPSHIFAQIRTHTGNDCNLTVLHTIFLELMPQQIRGLLVASNKQELQELAAFVDVDADTMDISSAQAFAVFGFETQTI